MFSWIIITLSVALGMTLYLGFRFILPMSDKKRYRMTAWITLGVILIGQRLAWVARRNGHDPYLLDMADWIGYVFLGFVSFVILLSLLRDIPAIIKWFCRMGRKLGSMVCPISPPKPIDPERRRFVTNITNLGIIGIATPVTTYAVWEARCNPEITRIDIPVKDLPPDLEGFTIVQISDTHVGPTIKKPFMERLVKIINELKPDTVVHTGDIIDGHTYWLKPDVAPLGRIHAKYGKYFCTGNHEYYSGVKGWTKEMWKFGFEPLVNSHHLIKVGDAKLLMAGVTDLHGGRFLPSHEPNPAKALKGAPEHDYSVMLAHRPRTAPQHAKLGVDLQLSGHTHGGQFFPWTEVIKLIQPYVRGLYKVGNMNLYVNRGTGYWGPPLRLGSKPEVTVVKLVRG